jgi:enamine deaminase RidA (YjgF/YER057c/UK114 family)
VGILSRLRRSRAFGWLRGSRAANDAIWRYGSDPSAMKVVAVQHWIFLAAMTADDTSVGIAEQTRDVLAKIDTYLAVANSNRSKLLSATIYLSDISLRPRMTEVWNAWIEADDSPTVDCIGAGLEGSTLVAIVVTAAG